MTAPASLPLFSSLRVARRAGLIALLAGSSVTWLSGCGAGLPLASSGAEASALSGVVHGGQSPIENATLTLYTTSSSATAYGTGATVIGTATSDANGNFTLSPSANSTNCPAGQQAYVTAAGGYQSGQPTLANTSVLMMAALGDCSTISSQTYILLNEVTTVAAAYALSSFTTTTENSSTGLYSANVGAPVANNSGTASAAATAPAGLAHAFANANHLVSYSAGLPLSTVSVNGNGDKITGTVPYVEILTLADMVQSCVDGATGNANCSKLFSLTPSISGTSPSNTLQAMLNLARNPYPSDLAMDGSSGLIALVGSSSAFQPTLTSVPRDWSLSITYGMGTLPVAAGVTLDANDSVYYGVKTPGTGTPGLVGLSAYGISTPSFDALPYSAGATALAADALGNIWVTNGGTGLYRYATTLSTGQTTSPYNAYTTLDYSYAVAVDAHNNVWVGHSIVGSPNIDEFSYANSWAENYTATAPAGLNGISVDASQNIWGAAYYSRGSGDTTQAVMIPNTGTAASPVYTPSVSGGTLLNTLTETFAGSAYQPFSVTFDASGNAWYDIYGGAGYGTSGIEEVIPNALTSATTLAPQSFITGATVENTTLGRTFGTSDALAGAIDGSGTLFIPDNNDASFGLHAYMTQSNTAGGTQVLSPFHGFQSCYLATATTTTCGTNGNAAISNTQQLAIDSTGSVWAPIGAGGMTQIIGVAAPTYPLLSAGKPGLAPGSATPYTLP